jgi:16S rRNA (guanine527-N7)-methyltransferase
MADGALRTDGTTVPDAADPLDGDGRLPSYFGDAWPAVTEFAALLRAHGVERGLVGPNEVGRLWERHLLNSAGGVALLPEAGTLVDLGSGGGLPGIVLAAMRPRARVVLLEPMERRTDWLRFVVGELGLSNTEVLRGRAEDVAGEFFADALTARAVSSLDKLYHWAAPLVRMGGGMFAIKGARALVELEAARAAERRNGWSEASVIEAGTLPGVEVTRVVHAVRTEVRARVR